MVGDALRLERYPSLRAAAKQSRRGPQPLSLDCFVAAPRQMHAFAGPRNDDLMRWRAPPLPHQPQHVLHRIHIRPRDRARFVAAFGEDGVDVGGVVIQPQDFAADRAEFGDGQIG
jgi:hypothetical protein